MAPQVGFEPTTLRLTAERLIAASHCKHRYLDVKGRDLGGNWGDSGGTPSQITAQDHQRLNKSADRSSTWYPSPSKSLRLEIGRATRIDR